MKITSLLCGAALLGLPSLALAADITIKMHVINDKGMGDAIGTVRAVDTKGGMMLVPRLKGMSAGDHGFHVHESANCGPKEQNGRMTPGLAAGGHWDPAKSGKHLGPQGEGHQGDLPALTVAADGTAKKAVVAPRLKVADLKGKSLMIHAGGDNYSDQPAPLGGGGARVACGTIR
ncbi:MAG TPA: superoxide dismutase [Cu-Zn] SodC [Alphaproteobacteria bacterium]|nr:superoxide dismutase [Cu-Zn] SodC [Alphaproteobacteria bacterium]